MASILLRGSRKISLAYANSHGNVAYVRLSDQEVTEVDESLWSRLKDRPTTQGYLEEGTVIELGPSIAQASVDGEVYLTATDPKKTPAQLAAEQAAAQTFPTPKRRG